MGSLADGLGLSRWHLLRFSYNGVKGSLGLALCIEQQRFAEAPPGIPIGDAPESYQLDVLAMFKEHAEQAGVLVSKLLIRIVSHASTSCLSVLRDIRALAALACFRSIHVQFSD